MSWTIVSAGGKGSRNDDLVRVLEHGDVTEVLMLDGATSLAGRDYADPVEGDPAWFVRAFAAAFDAVADARRDQEEIVQAALAAVREDWTRRGGAEVPLYAWPIAALSWIRIRKDAAGCLLELYCLGDCKVLLGQADGQVDDLDPFDNAYEHQLQQAVAALVADGMLDPARRFAALTPMLRERRVELNTTAAPEVLCLAPRGRFAARRRALRLDGQGALLAMSDGFYRLTDPYALYDDAALMRACMERGPQALLDELRGFEAARDTARLAVKGADDASAVLVRLGAPDDEDTVLVERYIAAYNAFDVDGMLAQLADEVRFENHAGGELTMATDGIDAFRRLAEQSKSLFSEREQRIVKLERVGATLLASIAYRGVLAADIPGGPAAGTALELNGRSEFSFEAGRIVRIVDRS